MSSNKFLLNIVKERPLLFFLIIIFSFSGAIFNGVSTALIVPIVVVFLGNSEDNISEQLTILKPIFSLFESFQGEQKLIVMIGAIILAIFLKNATNYTSIMLGNYYSKYLVNRLRLEGLTLLLEVGMDFYVKNQIGDIINRINLEVEKTAAAIRNGTGILINSITILTFIYFLLLISWQLTIITTILLGIVVSLNQFFVNYSRKLGGELAEKSRQYSRGIMELILGIRLIQTVSNEKYEYEQIKQLIKQREKAQLQSLSISAIIGPLNEISGIIAILFLILLGRYLFTQQIQEFAPILLTYLVILFRLLPFIGQLNNARTQFANNIPSVEIVADFLRRDNKLFLSTGNKRLTQLTQGISFEKVSFSYPGHDKIILKEINLWIPKGRTIALVGASGAGKSTIADLLPRFYDPTNGRITIDGVDLREYDLRSLRQTMGVVSQDTFLFNNSIRYNIAYGMPEVTEEEIVAAAKRANAHEFITQLSQGLNTEIGDRGVMLSGGQRQRIAIARALLRNPDILILDEATSALDTVSERLVQEAIEELSRDRTTLVIAHRLSTIQKAYQIVVLDRGKIVEIGNHEELLAKNGYYARLYALQFQKKTEAKLNQISQEISLNFNQFATNFSYEIRNSLNSLLGSLWLVTEGLVDNPKEHYKLVEESYQSAKNLLNTLKNYEARALQKCK
ncbi:ATP-binding cassette domain-containing protein [Pleurocapsales cyanobacterium LEGE 06147]|nr:ATP-binding cassette domain-containing protein [Pleurocapsales cyanobacterium LEGE 06147]